MMLVIRRSLLAIALVAMWVTQAWAGPVILAGHDADDHGFQTVYAGLFNSLLRNVTNGRSGILAIGANTGSTAANWITSVASRMSPAQSVTFVNGAAISSIDFSQFAILRIPSDSGNTFGGITATENSRLVARARDIADFINGGGGLFGLTQGQRADAYGYLSFFGLISTLTVPPTGALPSGQFYDNVTATAAGQENGLTNTNVDGCCWHNVFTAFPSFLAVLATANEPADPSFNGQAAVLGGTTVRVGQPTFGLAGGTGRSWGMVAEPVNTATGNYVFQRTDLTIPGRGLPLTFSRAYNSLDSYTGPLGRGWTHSYNVRLTETPTGLVIVKLGDGQEEFYDPIGGGNYQSRFAGVFNVLVQNPNGTFTLTQKDQTQFRFDANGKLTSIVDKNNNSVSLTYDSLGNMSRITDTVGRIVTLTYDSANRITQILDPLGRAVRYSYNAGGDLSSVTDLNGGVTTFSYDTSRRLTKVVNPQGNVLLENTYDASGRVSIQTNGNGFSTTFAYGVPQTADTLITDARGNSFIHTHDEKLRLIQETDALGNMVDYAYDDDNNRTSITDKNGTTTLFTYDSRGNVTSKTDPLGNVTAITYDSLNDPLTRTDALGNVTSYSYDAKGNLIQVTDPLGNISRISYDTFGQPVSLTNARGAVTVNAFDAQGNLVTITDAAGNQTSFTYDGVGRRIGVTNARGLTTSFTYDNNNNLLRVVDPLGNATAHAYDANNNRIRVTDPRGNATIFAYDANDLLSSVQDPLGHTTTYAYDAVNNRTVVTDARGNSTRYTYDAANRLLSVTDALGNPTTYAYDPNGNILRQTNPLGHVTTFTYDALNRLLSTTDALGNSTQNAYDALGRLIQGTDANGRATRYSYDALGRLDGVIDPAGGTAAYSYDAVGNRTGITDPNGNSSTFAYDAVNRLFSETDPLGNSYLYAYDQVGNRVQLTDSKGNLIRYAYDPNNRLVEIVYPDLSHVNFQYDPSGNRSQMTDALGTSNYQYDSLNRLTQYIDPFNKTVGYSYDQVGNRTTLIYPDGKIVSYTYDGLNRMQTVTDWLGGVTTYTYDPAGNLFSIDNPNATMTDYFYDSAERLVGLGNFKSDASTIASYGITLDPVGNRTSINRIEPLAPVFTPKNESLSYDQDNRLLTINGSSVSHDPNGNLTNKQGTTYDYDFRDRLVRVNGGINAYQYDGVGNRLVATRGGVTNRYTLDIAGPLSNVLVESDRFGNTIASYVHGLGLISRITPTNDARHYHYDPVGSTVALTNAGQNVTDSYSYDPFGAVMNSQQSTSNPFLYVGRFGLTDEGDQLRFARARYYASNNGRFLSRDPIEGDLSRNQAINKYIYALNNPFTFVDPSGLWVIGVGVELEAGFGVGASGAGLLLVDNYGNQGFAVEGALGLTLPTASVGRTLLVVPDKNARISDIESVGCSISLGADVPGLSIGIAGVGVGIEFLGDSACYDIKGVAVGADIGIGSPVSLFIDPKDNKFSATRVVPIQSSVWYLMQFIGPFAGDVLFLEAARKRGGTVEISIDKASELLEYGNRLLHGQQQLGFHK